MSRIGKLPITVPAGVTITIADRRIAVKGPKGELSRPIPGRIDVTQDGNVLSVTRPSDETSDKAMHGLTRTLVANMVEGVTTGFKKQLEIVGVGYKAEVRPFGLQLALGTAERPRLVVFRSLKHIYAQIVDDTAQRTLMTVTDQSLSGTKTEKSVAVGKLVAEKAKASGITQVVFDRGGYQYHGRVKAVADGAREAGLEF